MGCAFAARCLCCILADARAKEVQGLQPPASKEEQVHLLNGMPQSERTESS
jgi:hypothetical protein